MPLTYQYDPKKARTNLRKHGVSFDEAITAVLLDPLNISWTDESHSFVEERLNAIGMSSFGRMLFVVYTQSDSTAPHQRTCRNRDRACPL